MFRTLLRVVACAAASVLLAIACSSGGDAVEDSSPTTNGSNPGGATTTTTQGRVPAGRSMVDRSSTLGIDIADRTSEVTAADLDGDGRLDLLFPLQAVRLAVYRNDQQAFTPDTELEREGRPNRRHCVTGDVNGDERVDVYCVTGPATATDPGASELWLDTGEPGPDRWVDAAGDWGVDLPGANGRLAVLEDLDGDGRPDLVVANGPDGAGRSVDVVFRNEGTVFRPVPDAGLAPDVTSRCLRAVDLDGDGLVDLVSCAGNDTRVYRNVGGLRFEATPDLVPFGLTRVGSAAFVDLDSDGAPDSVVLRGRRVEVYRSTEPDRDPVRLVISDARDLTVGDFDGDGVQDIWVVRRGPDCRTTLVDAPDAVFFGDLVGTFLPPREVETPFGCGGRAEAADLDGDGDDEVVVLNGFGPLRPPEPDPAAADGSGATGPDPQTVYVFDGARIRG